MGHAPAENCLETIIVTDATGLLLTVSHRVSSATNPPHRTGAFMLEFGGVARWSNATSEPRFLSAWIAPTFIVTDHAICNGRTAFDFAETSHYAGMTELPAGCGFG